MSSAMKMSTAVVARLIGYTSRIDRNVWCSGNTVLIQMMRTPHTPKSVKIAGTSEMPNPRR